MKRSQLSLLVALALGVSATTVSGGAFAQSTGDMKAQIDALQHQLEVLKQRLDNQEAKQAQMPAQAASPAGVAGHDFLERKKGDNMTLLTHGGEVTLYGKLDLSVDSTTKGIGGMVNPNGGDSPVGDMGWMPAISTNISYIGLKGFQTIGGEPYNFVWQLETQIDVSATSGSAMSTSNQSDTVKGALTSRNSFVGLAGDFGAIKIGKTDAPYKNSTGRMNAFSGMLGDYSVIMGNSGGDNRVEFGTRMDHAIWYESPNWSGFKLNALFAPGQNRATDSSNVASGESDCTGGNIPGSGGIPPTCSDGSFSDALSASLAYTAGPLYLTAAYEAHRKVNRSSDISTLVDNATPAPDSYGPADVADETAAKIGAQYKFPTKTTVSAIYENMKRNVPSFLSYQNERQRSGTWLALSQAFSGGNSLHFGWAHAGKTPGDPGQHNTLITANPNNTANMYTIAAIHQVDKNMSYYANYATTVNTSETHYDLGAGGHGITTDCHDASGGIGSGPLANPHCWAGGKLQGVSLGMNYKF